VGLISIILLLCLATFAFATRHYQDEVMEEIGKTVSVIGKAAFQSLEEHAEVRLGGMQVISGQVFIDESAVEHPLKAREVHVFTQAGEEGCPPKGGALPLMFKRIIETEDEGTLTEIRIIRTDAIHVEGNVDQGLALRIPVGRPAEDVNDKESKVEFYMTWTDEDGMAGEAAAEPQMVAMQSKDIVLPIPTGDYGDLFDTFRKKSIILFCGVFAVGIALSTGLASRFTRPVRRLDSGIKRLAEGDLDVQVLVRGNDEVARLGLAFNDMTRRLRAGRERTREMTRREKQSALGRLAAGVAHDVRNPLHSINLTLQHLQEACRPEGEAQAEEFDRSTGIIREEIRRLNRLIENFLLFARTDRSEHSPVDLAELLQEMARLVRKEAEWRKVEVKVEAEEHVPPLTADVEAIRSSILNLVLNSFEAMPDGGELTLSLKMEEDSVILTIADTGVGIPEGDHERVFDFSYSTREGGSGLGLAMVHQYVVENHGGKVHLDSREGEGTTVRLAFPLQGGVDR